MCGRFTLFVDPEWLGEYFNIVNIGQLTFQPRYNIAPNQDVVSIIRDKDNKNNRAGMMRWNLLPSFMKEPKSKYTMINARDNTIDEKPSYRRLLPSRRCIIPASGFYEWDQNAKPKEPYHIQLKSKEPMAFAGLWDRWEKDGEEIISCTIITTTANAMVEKIHHRMPVILSPEDADAWLDRGNSDKGYLKSLLTPYDSEQMEMYRVGRAVGNVHNQGEALIAAVP